MTVGESLSEARYQAGLSVDELSERTRIRDSVIRSIERDDYEACGGDLYVRGYVRTIAGAVGIDAQPLIQEFDQERVHGASSAGDVDDVGRASGARPYVPPAAVAADPSARRAATRTAFHLDWTFAPAWCRLTSGASAARGGWPVGPRRDPIRPAGRARRSHRDQVRSAAGARGSHRGQPMAALLRPAAPCAGRRASATPPGGWGMSRLLTAGPRPLPAPRPSAARPPTRRGGRPGRRPLAGWPPWRCWPSSSS